MVINFESTNNYLQLFTNINVFISELLGWKKAPIHQEFLAGSGFEFLLEDEILVPMGCTCVINALKPGTPNLPVIIF